jgi:hypothetical protein
LMRSEDGDAESAKRRVNRIDMTSAAGPDGVAKKRGTTWRPP